MKTFLLLFAVSVLSIFSPLSSLESDQQIQTALQSQTFSNELVQVEFEGKSYPIRILTNPSKESLWGGVLAYPTTLSLVVVGNLPLPLVHHLEDLLTQWGCGGDDAHIHLRGTSPLDMDEWKDIHPVYIAQAVDDPKNDAEAERVFNSTSFENKVLYYKLNGKVLQVRLLRNPEGRSYSSTKAYSLEPGDPLCNYTTSWNKYFGIFVDERAPQELIDHLSEFVYVSWWDWWFNFSVENGTCAEYKVSGFNQHIIYYLGTWFDIGADFH